MRADAGSGLDWLQITPGKRVSKPVPSQLPFSWPLSPHESNRYPSNWDGGWSLEFTTILKRLEFHKKKSRLRFRLPRLIGLMSRNKAAPVTNPTTWAAQPLTSQSVDRRDQRMGTVVEAGKLDPSHLTPPHGMRIQSPDLLIFQQKLNTCI